MAGRASKLFQITIFKDARERGEPRERPTFFLLFSAAQHARMVR